eukprot:jgi/Bigna1/86313/estExt_fgenesh1_pg.C_90258
MALNAAAVALWRRALPAAARRSPIFAQMVQKRWLASTSDADAEERKRRIMEIFQEKERQRVERKGLAKKIERNLYRSPLVDPDDEEPDDILDTCHIIDPEHHKYTLVWLHGIDEGNSKAKTMMTMISPDDVKVVIPNAPKIPLTALDEREARAWWDIEQEDSQGNPADEEDAAGIRESHQAVIRILEHEEAIIGSENIIIAGFGQGASLALHAALRYPVKLCAVMMWAGYVVEFERYPEAFAEANQETKILAYHGKDDDVVRPQLALAGMKELKSYGLNVEMRLVPRMGHYIDHNQWVQGFDWCMRQFQSRG